MEFRNLTIKEKALKINLDENHYGSIAEIGAGQEVAAHFFKAGGASGTIAKTMSAYDMKFSDAIYGKDKRYVSEARVMKMLSKEYRLLAERLEHRTENTCFFAFANTIETLNYRKTNQGHGWIGVRFQTAPNKEPNDCIIHVQLHDTNAIWQQQVVGDIGVNLIFGCLFNWDSPYHIIDSLMNNIESGRVEVDMIRLKGPGFDKFDNRLLSLHLVKNGLTKAAMFDHHGNVIQPTEALYKKNIIALRGRFRPVTYVNLDMLESGTRQFKNSLPLEEQKNTLVLCEITLNDLRVDSPDIDTKDFLDRVDILCGLGQTVMISNFPEYFRLSEYLAKMTKKQVGLILGVRNVIKILDEKYYEDLSGGLMEAISRLFARNVKLFVFPSQYHKGEELATCDNINLPFLVFGLFRYLYDNDRLIDIQGVKKEHLHIVSDHVLEMIRRGEDTWEPLVPEKVCASIKEFCLFDYPCSIEEKVSANGKSLKKAIIEIPDKTQK